jgi:hypothetical protein
MRTRAPLLVVAALFAALFETGVMAQTLELDGSNSLVLSSSYQQANLYDSSALTLASGGFLGRADVYNDSVLSVSGGIVSTNWVSFPQDVGGIHAYNTSTVNVSAGDGGFVFANNNSVVNVTGGIVSSSRFDYGLRGYDFSTLNISGGTITQVWLGDNSTANVTGGVFTPVGYGTPGYYTFWAVQNSQANIYSGQLGYVAAANTATLRFFGTNFSASGGASLVGDRVVGTGVLSGSRSDGTPFSTVIVHNDASANILAVPEPSTCALLILSTAAAFWFTRKRRP